jgi:hypothetical protein
VIGTTVDAVIERVRRDAGLGLTGPTYTLRTAYTAGDPTIEVNETPDHMSQGSIVSIDTEMFYVTSVSAGSSLLNVIGGYYGTTAANHLDGSVIEVDSRLPKPALVDWAQHEIMSWRGQLFRVAEETVDTNVSERTYELDVDVEPDFLLDVRARPLGEPVEWSWNADAWPRVKARLLRRMPGADFTSTFAVQLRRPTRTMTSLRIVYASFFDLDPFELSTDLIADCGLTLGQLGVLEEGLRARALSAGLVARTDYRATGMSRDGEETTLIDIVRAVDMARSLRDRRFAEEALDLRKQFPYASWS